MRNVPTTAMLFIPIVMAFPMACAQVAAPSPLPVEKVAKEAPSSSATVDVIKLRRSGHAIKAPFYEVTLKKDGSVVYIGQFNVERIGSFRAKIKVEDFEQLERTIVKLGYFDMKDEYPGPFDSEIVDVSVSRGVQRKTIRDGGSTAPTDLQTIEMAIEKLVAGIADWSKVE